MTTGAEQKSNGIGKDVTIYLCILALSAIQFIVAYHSADTTQMFVRMLIIALVQAGLALLFFMHLASEKRVFMWFAGIITVFVLLTLQYGWTDAFRLVHGAPWSK
jgi:heme/copper-type cytochrome/quinol oxidase subunit 4